VKPVYKELPSWDREKISNARTEKAMPKEAKNFLKFISKELGLPVLMVTVGPRRSQSIML